LLAGELLADEGVFGHAPSLRRPGREVKPPDVGPSPRGHTTNTVRSGMHPRNSLIKLDVDGTGSGVLNALNELAETQ
jgi:hypothetical protein